MSVTVRIASPEEDCKITRACNLTHRDSFLFVNNSVLLITQPFIISV